MADIYVTDAIYEDGWLKLKIPETQAIRVLNNIKLGWMKITQREQPKSYEQIKLCWKLCELIADKKSKLENHITTKMEIYRSAIQEVGRWEMLGLDNEALTRFSKEWHSRGTGWFVSIVELGDEYSIINAYYGCSVYDKHEMHRLIEYLIQDAKSLNIPINTKEMEALLREE